MQGQIHPFLATMIDIIISHIFFFHITLLGHTNYLLKNEFKLFSGHLISDPNVFLGFYPRLRVNHISLSYKEKYTSTAVLLVKPIEFELPEEIQVTN